MYLISMRTAINFSQTIRGDKLMRINYLISGLVFGVFGLIVAACQKTPVQTQANSQADFNAAPIQANVRFSCSQGTDPTSQQTLPTIYALINDSKKAIIRWESDRFNSSGWQKDKRCQEVASRLEKSYNNQTLNIITNGTMNGQPVICTAASAGGDCQDLLITLKPEDDGVNIVKQLGEVLNGQPVVADAKSSDETGQIYMQLNIEQFAQLPTFQEE